jgi:hypothetical protein
MIVSVAAQTDPVRSEPNTTTAAGSVTTINEIMYHPAGDDPGMEWLEVHNQMSVNLDISGWRLEGGIEFQFPTNTVFLASSYLVVAAQPERMRASATPSDVYGPFTGRLSNGGETLRLRNQSGRLMDEVTYSDEDPWPVGPDGSGASLSKRDPFNASSAAANWRASARPGGTPGRANFNDAEAAGPAAIPLISTESPSRWLVPRDNSLGAAWTSPGFDDTGWTAGKSALGYDTGFEGPTESTNVALGKTVIDGSGAYSNNQFDLPDPAGNFIAQNVTDGSSSDFFGENYWLGRQGRLNEYFTLDLGRLFLIEEVRLRNTHNSQHNDRGTARFELWASSSIDTGKQLVDPVRILTGTLSDVTGLAPIPADLFTGSNGLIALNARYLKFVALTANNAGNNVGLNEIEVYAAALVSPDRAYSFDGTLSDSFGMGVDGENLGAQFSTNLPAPFASGQSLSFDGLASEARLPDAINPAAYTIALWVNVESVRSSGIILRTGSSGPRNSWSHQLRINGSDRFEHFVFDGTGRSVAATNAIVPGAWYHVALTAASNGEIRIYVNGARSGGATAINSLWEGGNEWRLGSAAGNAPNFFHGRLDELVIWHGVLADGAIASLAEGLSPTRSGGYHRFIESNLQDALFNKASSLWARIPFESPSQAPYEELTLRLRYADGFVAYLNGIEILRRNAPPILDWNSTATTNRADAEVIGVETIDLGAHAPKITVGGNVLAVQALNSSRSDPAFLFSAELLARPAQFDPITNLAFTEIAGAGSPSFFVEFRNHGESPISLAGCRIVTGDGTTYQFPSNTLSPDALLLLTADQLGFPVEDGDRLFLLGPGGELIDAVEVHHRPRSRQLPSPDGPWLFSTLETPGQPNTVTLRHEVVINEVMYHHPPIFRSQETPFTENGEQWIELYNTSDRAINLSGWRLDGEVSFLIPGGTVLGPDSYVVIANNAVALRLKYPGITVLGHFVGRLSHHSARIVLRDAAGNPADEVRYYNSHPWPAYANGGGSTLELRDPRSDNNSPESWSASSEGPKVDWRRYSYRATAVRPVYTPSLFNFHEFRIGLLDEGEALIDNITVTELPAGAPPRQLLQNTDFSRGTLAWRLLGNHSHSLVPTNPGSTSNSVLCLIATGSTSYLDNRLETTLKAGNTVVPVVTGREYEIAFDAKWLAGSPQLRTELYYNKVAATTILDMPAHPGTPGRRNSLYDSNSGPTYSHLTHSPVIPKAAETIRVRVNATDPDRLAAMRLFYSINGGTWRDVAMNAIGEDSTSYIGQISPQANGAVIQFYIQGTDGLGSASTYPARGPASRALIKVDAARTVPGKQTFRTIMTAADSSLLHSEINMMSDDLLGCTVVHNEREVFYDARIRLHGSMFSRNQPDLTGMTVKFPANHRFRGSRESVIVRRRGLVETIVKHILNSAGGLPGNHDDVVHLVSHRSDNTGTARLNLANYDDTYVESQFEGDDNGTVFKLEGIREYQTTQTGNPEGYKLSRPIGWILPFDIANLGHDPEQYRWGIMIQSDRRRDDYSRIVAMGKAFSLSGTALKQAAAEAIDIDKWARLFALQSLLGIGDVYGVDNPHNFAFYVRPSDGRIVGLQNDWEFAFARAPTESIYGNKNVYKVLRLPGVQRVYQGHLLDLIESVVSSSYLTPWARHYSTLTGENYNSLPSYAATRASYARSQLAPKIPFEIRSSNGLDFEVTAPSVTLEGRGWINVYRIHQVGEIAPLSVAWLDDQRWQTTVPLAAGTNVIALRAYNFRGVPVGQDSISVTTTTSEFPQRDHLRITELMYHPAPPGMAEMLAGFTDADDFEYVEIINQGLVSVSLQGVRFIAGISFDFSAGGIPNLFPAERVLLVKNRLAFELRHGTNLPIAGEYSGSLSNGGERLRLVDAAGGTIHEFAYGDGGAWPASADGQGRSLQVRDLSGDYENPASWQASARLGGSPGSADVSPPIMLATITAGGQVRLSFEAAARMTYDIYTSNDLASGIWSLLVHLPAREEPRVEEFQDSTSRSARFYRVEGY